MQKEKRAWWYGVRTQTRDGQNHSNSSNSNFEHIFTFQSMSENLFSDMHRDDHVCGSIVKKKKKKKKTRLRVPFSFLLWLVFFGSFQSRTREPILLPALFLLKLTEHTFWYNSKLFSLSLSLSFFFFYLNYTILYTLFQPSQQFLPLSAAILLRFF